MAGLALVAFAAGEGWRYAHTDPGRLAIARWAPWSDRARLTELVSRRLRAALATAGAPEEAVRETPPGDHGASQVHWRAVLKPDASLLQANYAVSQSLGASGLEVLDGRERRNADGQSEVVLTVGLRGRATHELVLARQPHAEQGEPEPTSARLAVVVYGFDDDAALARSFFDLPAPFAVALPPEGKDVSALFRDARARQREVVLHLPLEPINYPQVNPGPGTILVNMKPTQVASVVRRDLARAGPVTAVANHLGSLATQDMTVMSAVYRELRRDRVPFLHMTPAAGAVCKPLASELGVAYDEPEAVIDYEARAKTTALLDKRWKTLLAETRVRGHTVVMVRATPMSRAWLEKALAVKRLDGVNLVPLSALLRRPPV